MNLKSLSYYNNIKILSSYILKLNITMHKEVLVKHRQLLDCYSALKCLFVMLNIDLSVRI